MTICQTAMSRAADQSEEALDVLNGTEQALMEVSEKGIQRGFAGIGEIVASSFGSIDALYEQGREITGLATHYIEFDRMTSGLQPSELIIIAARKNMRFVPIKTDDQLDLQAIHRVRDRLISRCTAVIHQLRASCSSEGWCLRRRQRSSRRPWPTFSRTRWQGEAARHQQARQRLSAQDPDPWRTSCRLADQA